MLRVRHAAIALLVGLFLAAPEAGAVATLSLDLDPSTPGVQTSVIVPSGTSVSVELLLTGIDASNPLDAFELEVVFDLTILTGLQPEVGPFLSPPILTIEAESLGGTSSLAAVTVGVGASSGSGILGLLDFDAIGVGTTSLSLRDVVLSAPFGRRISGAVLEGGIVTVVPEPVTAAQLLGGLLILAGWRRSRKR